MQRLSPGITTHFSIDICSSNLSFEVSDKYKINYDELEFDQLVSSGSAGEVYLGYYFGTPVAIKSKQILLYSSL